MRLTIVGIVSQKYSKPYSLYTIVARDHTKSNNKILTALNLKNHTDDEAQIYAHTKMAVDENKDVACNSSRVSRGGVSGLQKVHYLLHYYINGE